MNTRAVIIAGTQSGAGKTTITLGIMAALEKLGHNVTPFKCGPDFIDPSLHKLVTGKESRNLDIWMTGMDHVKSCFSEHGSKGDISIIEGVMGMFDGGPSSSASLAKDLSIPLILVLDVRSAAESGAAVLKGFEVFDPEIRPIGVILNMVGSEKHFQLVRDAIHDRCQAKILGYLPRTLDFSIPSRHLGLHMGEEAPIGEEKIDKLADSVIEHIDCKKLLELAEPRKSTTPQPTLPLTRKADTIVRIGIARDQSFCFYYQDNFDLLEQAGAELCFFSPLYDKSLPENIDGLYLGGGYPELYGEKLAQNRLLLNEIKEKIENYLPVYSECGGFMYLTEGITDLDGNFHKLVGIYPTRAAMQTKRVNLGYRELTTQTDSFFGPQGTILRGHEFHYSNIEPMEIECVYAVNNGKQEGYRYKNSLGGYMHLHFGFNPQAASDFIQFCKNHTP